MVFSQTSFLHHYYLSNQSPTKTPTSIQCADGCHRKITVFALAIAGGRCYLCSRRATERVTEKNQLCCLLEISYAVCSESPMLFTQTRLLTI